ncbi:hypothetical protein AEM51_13200 [Bacteroidetes bacterium UKL13-3]|nr:hypothetical protein AEM51_13200 [Bacteroidetes bacterium UKL13-3]
MIKIYDLRIIKSQVQNLKSQIKLSEIKPLEPAQDNACEGKSKKFSNLVCTLKRQLLSVCSVMNMQYHSKRVKQNLKRTSTLDAVFVKP